MFAQGVAQPEAITASDSGPDSGADAAEILKNRGPATTAPDAQRTRALPNPVDLPNLQAMPSGEAALAAVSAHAVLTGACCDSHGQVWSWVKVALCSKRLSGCALVDPQGALVSAISCALRRWWTRVSVPEYREAQQALTRAVM